MAARSAVDLLTSRALSLALQTAEPETTAMVLARLAAGNASALRRALQRIQSQRPERSLVADRAVAGLRLALRTIDRQSVA